MEGSQINASLQQSRCTTQLTTADWDVSTSGPHVFLFEETKSLRRRLSNGRQIATRCVLNVWTSVRRNPKLFMTVPVTASSQTSVLAGREAQRTWPTLHITVDQHC